MQPNGGISRGNDCGLCGLYPRWLRGQATQKNFIAVYGLLGTIQAMAFIYIVVTLTTLEKRFKITSRTTGIILSGNEISQILSLILIYYGGSGHRPRWIAIGVGLSAASCLVLALPHFIYGPGKDALALTKEHLDHTLLNVTTPKDVSICSRKSHLEECDEDSMLDISLFPRLLVFFSQFILGIGTTLYYGLGQTYLDDNAKKKNAPMLLGFTFALRTIGPAIGFLLGYACLSLYIDPSLHPVITKKDPRWMGAWWLGWIILGIIMGVFAVLIAMFPRHLPAKPKAVVHKEGEVPLKLDLVSNEKNSPHNQEATKAKTIEDDHVPTLRDFPKSMKRLLTNWLLTCNNISAVFYVLGASAYITYVAKYMEVQYGTSAAGGIVIAGPISLIGMVLGFFLSGLVISKFKPGPRPLLAWNVIVGFCFVLGQISFIFLGCSGAGIRGLDLQTMQLNLTSECNVKCNCDGVKYAPVCHESSMTTFYSACHAGCTTILDDREFGNCSCVSPSQNENILETKNRSWLSLQKEHEYLPEVPVDPAVLLDVVKAGPCQTDCGNSYILFVVLTCLIQTLACSGKIGNVLVSYRGVDKKDKSFAQGVTLMIISLFALIPGPIIFGAIIDSTCLIWEESCGTRGNCWFYHRDNFRYLVNVFAAGFSLVGAFLDIFVCYLGKNLDLYGTLEDDGRREFTKDTFAQSTCQKQEVNGNVNANQRVE